MCEKKAVFSTYSHVNGKQCTDFFSSSEHLHPNSLNASKAVAEIKHEAAENLAAVSHSILATMFI